MEDMCVYLRGLLFGICVFGALAEVARASSPHVVYPGKSLKIACSSANGVLNLEWIFFGEGNVTEIIGQEGNPRVVRVSENVLELRLVSASYNNSGLYMCRDHYNFSNGVGMFVHVLVKEPSARKCNENLHECGNRCISKRYLCDHVVDCKDHSDEVNCPKECDKHTEFRCDNGQCIKSEYVCDEMHGEDCRDGSDERNCPNRRYVFTGQGQVQDRGTGAPPAYVMSYESRTWHFHGIYSVVAGVIGLVCVITIVVITICRVHMQRDAQRALLAARRAHPRTRTRTRTTSSGVGYPAAGCCYPPTVALYIEGRPLREPPDLPPGVPLGPPPPSMELDALLVKPPPYTEVEASADGAPPPYEAAAATAAAASDDNALPITAPAGCFRYGTEEPVPPGDVPGGSEAHFQNTAPPT